MQFNAPKVRFGQADQADDEDDGRGLPKPMTFRARARRAAGIREATEALATLPGPGESIHAVCTARLDLSDLINGLIERLGAVERLQIATLGFNAKNLSAMLRWLDAGQVQHLSLLTSKFHRAHKPQLWEQTLEEFRKRRQRAAACHSHAKVVTLAFADGGRYSIEGSANLCGNGSGREQFALVNDAALHDWHAAWIGELVTRFEGRES